MYWYDGELANATQLTLPIDEPGLLFGATTFSTLRAIEGQPLAWEAHRARLQATVTALGWQPPQWAQLERGVSEMAARYPVLRVTLFPNGCEWIVGRALPLDLARWQQEGAIALVITGLARSLPAHKTGNYLACWQARRAALAVGAQEAILTDAAGNWLETSTGNLWGWRTGTWLTPPVEAGILPGIARAQLLHRLGAQGRPALVSSWTPTLVAQLEAVAYCNCVVGVVPLREVRWPTGQTARYDAATPAIAELQKSWVASSGRA